MKKVVWRGLDAPRMEIAHVDGIDRARGTQIGADYELRWQLDGPELALEVIGGRTARYHIEEADFFDVLNSPFFNSLPVIRDRLLTQPEPRDYVMRFIEVPALTASLLPQRYEPLGDGVVRYRARSFAADIEFDADGYVVLYPGYMERVSIT